MGEMEWEDEESTKSSVGKADHKRSVKTGTAIFVPHDVMKLPSVVAAYTRNKVSPTAVTSIFHALITDCGGDPNSVILTHSTVHRYIPYFMSKIYMFHGLNRYQFIDKSI